MRRRDHERIVHEIKRAHEGEVQAWREALDRVMYLSGQTWTPPPPGEEEEPEAVEAYAWSPEQSLDADADLAADYATQ